MRKGFKIGIIIIGVLVGLMFVIPLAMKNKIVQMVKLEANELLDAQFDFEDLSISLFRNFPDVSIGVKNVSLVGNGAFEGDTLLAASRIRAAVNILSLLGDGGFQVEEVLFEDALMQGLVDSTGKANWEIVRSMPKEGVDKPVEADESAVSLHLNAFRLKNITVRYKDVPTGTAIVFDGLDLTLSGNMDADRSDLKANLVVEHASVAIDHATYLKNMRLQADLNLDADLQNKRFNFKENKVAINAIETAFEGWVGVPDSTRLEMDVKLNTSRVNFKELLSLVPAIYSNDFDQLEAQGNVQLEAMAKGSFTRDSLPAFKIGLAVENGAFKYAQFNESVSDIQIKARIESAGGSPDQVQAMVDRFHFLLAGNPFDMTASATRLKSEQRFDLTATGKMNLAKLKAVYPLPDSLSLQGLLTADLQVAGSMAEIERKQYERINARGKFQLEGFDLKRPSGDPLAIQSALLVFSPAFVELQELQATMGKNQVRVTGRLEQLIPYLLKDETLKGSVKVTSDYLCVNDFMTPADTTKTEVAKNDTVTQQLLRIPKNLNLTTELLLKEVVMDQIALTDVKGKMQLNAGKAILNGITFNAFDGTIGAAGTYDSNPQQPTFDMGLTVAHASFAKTFKSVTSLQKLAPIFENMQGTYGMTLGMKCSLLPGMTPDLNSVDANGRLQSSDVRISGVAALDKLAEVLKYPALKEIAPKNLDVTFQVRDGQIEVQPFQLQVGDVGLTLGGRTGLDQSIDYTGFVNTGTKGISILGLKIQKIPFKITGSFKSPQVALDTKAIESSVGSDLKDAVKGFLKGFK